MSKEFLDTQTFSRLLTKLNDPDVEVSAEAMTTLVEHNNSLLDEITDRENRLKEQAEKYAALAVRFSTRPEEVSLETEEEIERRKAQEEDSMIEDFIAKGE